MSGRRGDRDNHRSDRNIELTMKKFQESCVEIRRQKPRVAGGNTKPHGRRPTFKRKRLERIKYKQPKTEGKKSKRQKSTLEGAKSLLPRPEIHKPIIGICFFLEFLSFEPLANRRNCEPLSCVVCLWPSDMGAPVRLRSKSHLMNRHTKLENAALAS